MEALADIEGVEEPASLLQFLNDSADSKPLRRSSSFVEGPGVQGGEALSAANLQAFAEALAQKALVRNLQPHLDIVVAEFRSLVPRSLRESLSWEQVQDRISGRRLESEAFVSAWRENTTYRSCAQEDVGVRMWWEYVSCRSAADLQQLFAWCTGFAAMPATPWKFQITGVDDPGRCPTVNTCMTDDPSAANRGIKMPTMYLPTYECEATLARKIEWALAGALGLYLC